MTPSGTFDRVARRDGAADPPPDQVQRGRIAGDLDTNLLVEAGAGSGKTTELVNRMLSLVQTRVGVERLAAVTFTRKAAGELAQRFRECLEASAAEATRSGSPDAARLDEALRGVDRAFVGTIHSFCARMLREHPIEAGVDPGFAELGEAEANRLADEYWTWHLDARHAAGDPALDRLREVGIEPGELRKAFRERLDDGDVTFPIVDVPAPEFERERAELSALMERGAGLARNRPVGVEPDKCQRTLSRLEFLARASGWRTARDFCAAMEGVSKTGCEVRQYRWSEDKAVGKQAKELGGDLRRFVEGPREALLARWRAHRYGPVMRFLEPLVRDFSAYRRRTGQLTFQDLLQLAAELLRDHPRVRRDLGLRYRHLLVDEFQDTDPLQAEVCLLLTSDPAEGSDWRHVRPRAGGLFVVGDPKQSIYRFRRADIEVYDLVYQRMKEVGDVLDLTANFRSKEAIGSFVNAVFEEAFTTGPRNPEQAAFAPMETRPNALGGRILRYVVPSAKGDDDAEIERRDARIVASWVAEQVRADRAAHDFLILPYRKRGVELYARELERRGIGVTTSGAGLTIERELRELLILLRALADPQDKVQTLAALEGLFFGLGPTQLLEHRAEGRPLSFEGVEFDPASPVERALATMASWRRLFRELPADSALEAMVRGTGLLPLAAGGEMAESRAGSLVHALDAVAAGAVRGAADLRSAIDAIEAAREGTEIEAPLRPGRLDVVRVMNLHKAKGLEAPIVILPHPLARPDRPCSKHVRRTESEGVLGYVRIQNEWGSTLAHPLDWDTWEGREVAFRAAEFRRLQYVACTRAMEILVVGECEKTHASSPWRELHAQLERQASELTVSPKEPGPRPVPASTPVTIGAEIERLEHARGLARTPAFSLTTVTAAAEEEELEFRGSEGRGREWGTLVHRALAAMGRGRVGEDLRAFCRGLLLQDERPRDAAGEPVELEDLLGLLARVRDSEAWRRAGAAAGSRWELAVARVEEPPEGPPVLVTGTIDAVSVGAPGEPWQVVDWKTDAADAGEWERRRRAYDRQVAAYCQILRSLAGSPVEGKVERVG